MKAAEHRSSFGFWIWGFVFLFLAHAFAIFWFSDRTNVEPLWQKPGAFFYVAGDPDAEKRIAEFTSLRDPTLFALPNAHGFSGGAWLNRQPEIPQPTNWSEPPESLALSADQLGGSLNDYVATNRPSEAQLFASLRAAKSPIVRIPDTPVFTNTTVRSEGELAARRLVRTPPLPSADQSDVLRPTVVVVSVNGNGMVETASVAGESGSRSADAQAIQLARRFEFEPLPIREARARQMASPTIGRLVFTWNIVPPTNAVPAVGAR